MQKTSQRRMLRLAALVLSFNVGCASGGGVLPVPCKTPPMEMDDEAAGVARDYPATDRWVGETMLTCCANDVIRGTLEAADCVVPE